MEKIFTIENISELANLMDEIAALAKSRKDYCYKSFLIVGDDAAEYANVYGFSKPNHTCAYSNGKLKGGSEDAVIQNAYYSEYYYDARNGSSGFSSLHKTTLVRYKGEFLEPNFCYGTTATLHIVFDTRIYHEKISAQWKQEHPEPNRVGTLTDRKIEEWYNYLTSRREEYDRVVNEETATITKFLAQVREVAAYCKDARIGDTQGQLRANNLVFSYSISKGYINKEIKVDYRGSNTLETFTKMIKGEF
ncbi:hypothetical protein [Prevotella sp. E2-28]|uniref:hypothetical protein n=1 Tax=Prevotella sp. E2-28 TaxID=2913620 RepID=UPI001EDB149C|nr:hypothetical protein [Prevotella sp. E2-28]UKK52705.1 hypothetical protein L6465_08815 [Prevotella sp. E2-28]